MTLAGPTTPELRLEGYLPLIRSEVGKKLGRKTSNGHCWGVCSLNTVEDVVQDIALVLLKKFRRYHSKGNDMSIESVRPGGVKTLIKYALRDVLEKNLPCGVYRDSITGGHKTPKTIQIMSGDPHKGPGGDNHLTGMKRESGKISPAAGTDSPHVSVIPESRPLDALEDPQICLLLDEMPEPLRQVATLAAEGFTRKEIASKLGVVTSTVHNRLQRIREQLDARTAPNNSI